MAHKAEILQVQQELNNNPSRMQGLCQAGSCLPRSGGDDGCDCSVGEQEARPMACGRCTQFSNDFQGLVFGDFLQTLEDVRRQFKDHNDLFIKQASLARTLLEKYPSTPYVINGDHGNVGKAAILFDEKTVESNGPLKATPIWSASPSGGQQDARRENEKPVSDAIAEVIQEYDAPAIGKQQSAQSEYQPRSSRVTVRAPVTDEGLATPEYNVDTFYHSSGICQAIARDDNFGLITLGVIAANAIYIGVDADRNHAPTLADADIGFQIMEYSFFVFFAFEWIVRFMSFESKKNCLKDMWFKFDSALVFMMVAETLILPIALGGGGIPIPTNLIKLIRLLRLARMARLMRALPELVAMIKGVRMASRAVGSALLMLLLLVYIFAILVFVLVGENRENNEILADRLSSLPIVMWTLLVDCAFMDAIGTLSRALLEIDEYICFIVLLVFVLASALTVMNMLIGVLCEVVTGVAASEKEDADVRLVKDTLLVMLMKLDENGNGQISKDEIDLVFKDDEAYKVLKHLNVEPIHLVDHLDMFFEGSDDGNLSINTIMDLILTLRGERPPTMKDMLHGQNFSRWKLQGALTDHEDKLIVQMKNMNTGMNTALRSMGSATFNPLTG